MPGVQYPIIQGAMGLRGTGTAKIAAPVSEAGGLGILTTICYKDPEEFRHGFRRHYRMSPETGNCLKLLKLKFLLFCRSPEAFGLIHFPKAKRPDALSVIRPFSFFSQGGRICSAKEART